MALARTDRFRREIQRTIPSRPFTVDFWDGTTLRSTDGAGPRFVVRSPKAVAHTLLAPGQLGIGRAYVAGDLEVEDMDATIKLLDSWKPPPLDRRARARLALAALRAAGLTRPPAAPAVELRLRGRRHSRARDAQAVRHHYDVSNEFFALFLDESMTYSCAIFSRGATTLEEAQEAKLELICAKLGLEPGQRVLDVGCGWGSFPIHAALRHEVEVVGITLSEPQRPPWPGDAPRRRAWRSAWTSACSTTASSPASGSTRSPASAWSSTSETSRSTCTPSVSPRSCAPAAGS